ncbi:MAG: hypothetical protein C4528_07475 [Gammaproteobacteria bacterium]|nr:MAG: hypothetical protein C4528_07475 [Gammaproteobacteria bacterium]
MSELNNQFSVTSPQGSMLVEAQNPLREDRGVDSLYSQQFSIGIFFFMLLAIIFFASIVVGFMAGKNVKGLKRGEKWLFAWIFLGIVVAVIFGALQLLGGYLV